MALVAAALAGLAAAQQEPRLKSRTELPAEAQAQPRNGLWILPAGTRIPIQLRQPISTKDARPGDAVYAQTSFPVVAGGHMVIPAGTWVQGVVDTVKRAGRLKGTAELQFHLTTLIYAGGYTVDIAAAIDRVPGSEETRMKEPGTVAHNSEKSKDLSRVGTDASQAGQIGAITGAAAGKSVRSLGIGGLSGVAAGTLIALLARGSDVKFDTGAAVEISLSHAMAIEAANLRSAPLP
jgi:type IV secretion system protein VirB10